VRRGPGRSVLRGGLGRLVPLIALLIALPKRGRRLPQLLRRLRLLLRRLLRPGLSQVLLRLGLFLPRLRHSVRGLPGHVLQPILGGRGVLVQRLLGLGLLLLPLLEPLLFRRISGPLLCLLLVPREAFGFLGRGLLLPRQVLERPGGLLPRRLGILRRFIAVLRCALPLSPVLLLLLVLLTSGLLLIILWLLLLLLVRRTRLLLVALLGLPLALLRLRLVLFLTIVLLLLLLLLLLSILDLLDLAPHQLHVLRRVGVCRVQFPRSAEQLLA